MTDILTDPRLYSDWAGVLGWLLDDSRFGGGWSQEMLNRFTEYASTLVGTGGRQSGPELVTAIRKGIAHSRTEIAKRDGELWITILSDGEPDASFPLGHIVKLHKAYTRIESGQNPVGDHP
ncbi:MAG: hypothetical protein LBR72_00390 [Oscillospiraceae bacterium]|jgi:hypothetical protein|nr:hypothetical protein [Oscillospiraceae bacterium]